MKESGMLLITFEIGISMVLAVLTVVVVPSGAWLVKEVLSLRNEMVKQQGEIAGIKENCLRHQAWQETLQRTLNRVDKNVVRLCEKNGVRYDPE
jgi:hypothetical protein